MKTEGEWGPAWVCRPGDHPVGNAAHRARGPACDPGWRGAGGRAARFQAHAAPEPGLRASLPLLPQPGTPPGLRVTLPLVPEPGNPLGSGRPRPFFLNLGTAGVQGNPAPYPSTWGLVEPGWPAPPPTSGPRDLGVAGVTLGATLLPAASPGDTLPGPGWPFSPSASPTQRHNGLEATGRAGLGNQGRMWPCCFPRPGRGCRPDTAIKAAKLPPAAGVAFMSGASPGERPPRWWAARTLQWELSPASGSGSPAPLVAPLGRPKSSHSSHSWGKQLWAELRRRGRDGGLCGGHIVG